VNGVTADEVGSEDRTCRTEERPENAQEDTKTGGLGEALSNSQATGFFSLKAVQSSGSRSPMREDWLGPPMQRFSEMLQQHPLFTGESSFVWCHGEASFSRLPVSSEPLSGLPGFSTPDCVAKPRSFARIGLNGPNVCCRRLNPSA
jgi:hypothetical protein